MPSIKTSCAQSTEGLLGKRSKMSSILARVLSMALDRGSSKQALRLRLVTIKVPIYKEDLNFMRNACV